MILGARPLAFFLSVRFVLVLICVLLLIGLGFWQLQRADEKRALYTNLGSAQAYPASSPAELIELERAHGRAIRLKGYFDNAHLWYLDNRIYQRRVGFEVIVPFRDERGWWLLVNRGFWEGTPQRTLPAVAPVTGTHVLRAQVYQPERVPVVLRPDTLGAKWPQLIQWVDVQAMWEALRSTTADRVALDDSRLFPYLVRLEPDQVGARPATWWMRTPWLSVERHLGYALTWFSLAFVLFAMSCWHGVKGRL